MCQIEHAKSLKVKATEVLTLALYLTYGRLAGRPRGSYRSIQLDFEVYQFDLLVIDYYQFSR